MSEFSKPKVASLPATAVAKVQEVEKKLGGVYVIAYEHPVEPATLTPQQLAQLTKVETELGVCLVAYRKE